MEWAPSREPERSRVPAKLNVGMVFHYYNVCFVFVCIYVRVYLGGSGGGERRYGYGYYYGDKT